MQNFEQMVNLYHSIFVGCGVAALILLIITAIIFIRLKIPKVFAELTGRTAKKAIQKMENMMQSRLKAELVQEKKIRCSGDEITEILDAEDAATNILTSGGEVADTEEFQILRSIVIVHAEGVD